MVVAHEHHDAAMLGRAGDIGVAEHVAAPVDARALAVPDGEDAVILALPAHLGLLAAPYRGRRQVLVEARFENDVVGIEKCFGAGELLVEPAERRTAVARHEPRRVQPGAPVALVLHHGGADNGLGTAQEYPAFGKIELIGKADIGERHGVPSLDHIRRGAAEHQLGKQY